MKYFLLKPKFVTEKIAETYEQLTEKLERDGHTVYNPLFDKNIYHLREDYDKDCEKHSKYVDRMPGFDEYCLLRFMMNLTNYDVLITPANRYNTSELALYYYACSIDMYIKEIQV